MIYSVIIGIVLAASHAPLGTAVPVLIGLVVLKGVAEIMIKKSLIGGNPSPYVLYLEKLKNSQSLGPYPWKGYLFQVIIFGSLLGLIAYAISFYFLIKILSI